MLKKAALLCAVVLLNMCNLRAQVGVRRALVIGNGQYKADEGSLGFRNLPMTAKDANQVGAVLEENGFKHENVTIAPDLDFNQMIIALSDFSKSLKPNDSALFYFSGHGFGLDGEDYIAPIHFQFGENKKSAIEAAISLRRVLTSIGRAKTSVVILDACRDEPHLPKALDATSGHSYGHLVPLQGVGSLVAFATSYGFTTSGASASGLSFYTQFLVQSLKAHPPSMKVALERAKFLLLQAHPNDPPPGIYNEMAGDFPLLGSAAGFSDVDEHGNSEAALNRPRLLQEVGQAYTATWDKVLFFQAWANPFAPASATVDHGILTIVSPSGNKVVESFSPDLLPQPKMFGAVPSTKLGFNGEELTKIANFYSSYDVFKKRLAEIASDGTNLPYKLATAGAAANETIMRGRDFYCSLNMTPPKVREIHPIPWNCNFVKWSLSNKH